MKITLKGLIPRADMMNMTWNSFERYPKRGEGIVLHVISKYKRKGCKCYKYSHSFFRIWQFNAYRFKPNSYVRRKNCVSHTFLWLPVNMLKADHYDRLEGRSVRGTESGVSKEIS